MTYILYSPPQNLLATIKTGRTYVQLWQGLPDLEFEVRKSGGGLPGLAYETDKAYVWVSPDALRAVQDDPAALLLAHVRRRKTGRQEVWDVCPIPKTTFGSDMSAAIKAAENFNLAVCVNRDN